MLGSGSDEEEIAGFERIAAAVVEEHAAALHDEVDLVLIVRRQRRGRDGAGAGELDFERPAAEEADGVRAVRTGRWVRAPA